MFQRLEQSLQAPAAQGLSNAVDTSCPLPKPCLLQPASPSVANLRSRLAWFREMHEVHHPDSLPAAVATRSHVRRLTVGSGSLKPDETTVIRIFGIITITTSAITIIMIIVILLIFMVMKQQL